MSAPKSQSVESAEASLEPSCRDTAAHALTIVRDGVITGEGPTTKGRVHFSRELDADDVAWCERILTAAAVEHQPVSRAEAEALFQISDAATERTRRIAHEVLLEVSPGEAVFEFVRRCVETPSSWRATTSRRPWSGSGADRALASLMPLIGRILKASQQAGTVRPDIVPTDLVMTLMSVRALGDLCDIDAPNASRRFLDLALDGLRAGHNTLAHPPTSIKQLGRVLTDR